jgi:hypothetical protein
MNHHQRVHARYLPAPSLRQARGLTPREISVVKEASARADSEAAR